MCHVSALGFNMRYGSVAEVKCYSKPDAVNVLRRSIGAILEGTRGPRDARCSGSARRARSRVAWRLEQLTIEDQIALADVLQEVSPVTIESKATRGSEH
jgi:hypothetical protein